MTTTVPDQAELLGARRLGFARDLQARGDTQAALELFESLTLDWPQWPKGWMIFAEAAERSGDRTGARRAYAEVLRLDPADRFGAGLRLARLGAAEAPDVPPPAFVRALFDEYAPRFEASLVGKLGYAVPRELARLLLANAPALGRVLDLGCGTGLMAEQLCGSAERIEGVDLSAQMIEMAQRKHLYDGLETADLSAALARRDAASLDTVAAADVFVYIGALAAVFEDVARVLRPGGRFAFSVEAAAEAEGWVLRDSLRYAHGEAYLRRALEKAGFAAVTITEGFLRHDQGAPITGFYVLASRAEVQMIAPVAVPGTVDLAPLPFEAAIPDAIAPTPLEH